MNKKAIQNNVREAVRRGILNKPSFCESCKTNKLPSQIAGHHYNGYGNPLDVIWLCQKCHTKVHFNEHGEHNGMAKLTKEVVVKIRQEYSKRWGELTRMAIKYGVGISTVRDVVRGNTWK